MTHPLIQKLQQIRKSIESIFEEPCEQVDLNYFYFAPIHERLAIHREEKRRGIDRLVPYQEKIQGDILEFKPHFELKLEEKGIHSIADRNLHWDFEWDGHFLSEKKGGKSLSEEKEKLIEGFRQRERSKGILNAILDLRNSAFFPKNDRGAVAYGRMAGSYLHKVVIKSLRLPFRRNIEIERFLDWCEDRTLKVSPFGFKERELRNPVEATLPIYIGETASYIRYCIQEACSAAPEERALQFAEIAIFLGLCCAASRSRSGYFDIVDILKVEVNSISPVLVKEKLTYQHRMENIIEKPKKPSKGGYNVLLMKSSESFLDDESLWSLTSAKGQPSQGLGEGDSFENVSVGGALVVISRTLASAIKKIGSFSITRRDVENLLGEAHKAIGLFQSSGGISPSCFLQQSHYWKGVDTRKSYKTQEGHSVKKLKKKKIRKI